MSGRTRIEVAKLARLLAAPPRRFDYLADLPAAEVRRVREMATDSLFGADRVVFERIALASRLVPNAVTAAIAQRAFGPLLCARVAGALEPARAADLARRLPAPFLADVAAELDPRRVAAVLPSLPGGLVVAVARELVRRDDFITLGRFVGRMPAPSLRAAVLVIDEPALLRIALFGEDDERFAEVFAMVPDARVPAVVAALVAEPDGFIVDLLPVVSTLDGAGLARLAAAARGLPDADRARLAGLTRTAGVADDLGSLGAALGL